MNVGEFESGVDSDETIADEEEDCEIIPPTPQKPKRVRKLPKKITKDFVLDSHTSTKDQSKHCSISVLYK